MISAPCQSSYFQKNASPLQLVAWRITYPSEHRPREIRMLSHERLACNPRQYHALHPDQCFVCRRPFAPGFTCTHKETGATTCSALCFTTYERWWLRTRQTVASAAIASPDSADGSAATLVANETQQMATRYPVPADARLFLLARWYSSLPAAEKAMRWGHAVGPLWNFRSMHFPG
jgi:hypothetical protein